VSRKTDFSTCVTGDSLKLPTIGSTTDIRELVNFLQENLNITELDLMCQEINGKGAEALAKLENITKLNLAGNIIGDGGVKALAKLKNLTELDLESNDISAEGAKALANGNFPNLTEFILHGNRVGNEGAEVLIKALDEGKFPKLTELNVNGNNISTNLKERLDNALKNIKRVKQTNNMLQSNPRKNDDIPIPEGNKLPIITASAGLLLGLSIAYFTGAATLTPVVTVVAVFLAAAAVGALAGYGIGKFCEKVSEEKQKDSDISTSSTAVNSMLTPQPFESQSKT